MDISDSENVSPLLNSKRTRACNNDTTSSLLPLGNAAFNTL